MSQPLPAYDPKNVFAKIIRGELPCLKIYEDDKTFAFLDIMPRSDGHTLVLPKAPARNIFDCSPGDLAVTAATVQKIAKAAQQVFSADGISIALNNEAAGGQDVFHLHFHVMPRKTGVPLRPPGQKADSALLEKHAAQMKVALA